MIHESRSCRDCGGTLPPDTDQCPVCLLRLGLEEQVTKSASERRSGTAASMSKIAELFPQLEILDLLGEGGMGVVYRARQRKLERLVALKILPLERSSDPAFAERFLREAQALARLQHPNIVSLYDFGEAAGHYFLIMEYADGLNLRQILLRGDLKPREALAIVPQICDGLQYAHEAGVIHRDIKPENVLVDRSGRVKITDFGLAKILDQTGPSITLTGIGQVMGTPQYMAPEQLANPRDVDHRADIYSLGVVFYELLTGHLPMGRFELPSRRIAVDVRLDEVVLRALEQDPDRRYQHASELKTEVSIATGAGAAEGGREVESSPAAPRWRSALRSFLWFTGVWVLCGFSFNAGPVALAGAAILFVAIGLVEARRHFGAGAIRAREPGRLGVWRRALCTGAAAALLALSFGLFFVAEVGGWERSAGGYVSSPQEPEVLLQVGADSLEELVARLGSPLRESGASALIHESSDVMDRPEIYRTRYLWIAAALSLGLGSLTFAGAAGALRPLRRLWLPLAGACAPALMALAAVNGLTAIPRWFAPPVALVPLVTTGEVAGEVSAVSDRLYLALLELGSTVDTRHRWSVRPPGAAHPTLGMQLLSGQPESPFDRWRITWTGPRRTFPHLVLTLVGPSSGDRTAVKIDAGRSSLDGEDRAPWQRLGEDLLARAGPRVEPGSRP
jgi:predicted Ser/Thr protein kinase